MDPVLIKLNIWQIISVYYKSLKLEFPPNERRPLMLIIKGLITHNYECMGAFFKNEMLGYAFLIKNGNDYLLDYLAVFKDYRCMGVGSRIIQALKEDYKYADSVIAEVENPLYAENEAENNTMSRRMAFYLKNGCLDTKVRSVTFGAHFIIIKLCGKEYGADDLQDLYRTHYRNSLPKGLFEGNINTYMSSEDI